MGRFLHPFHLNMLRYEFGVVQDLFLAFSARVIFQVTGKVQRIAAPASHNVLFCQVVTHWAPSVELWLAEVARKLAKRQIWGLIGFPAGFVSGWFCCFTCHETDNVSLLPLIVVEILFHWHFVLSPGMFLKSNNLLILVSHLHFCLNVFNLY